MFGLALIVILIVIGFFIFISFRQKIPVTDYKKSYIADETASNFVNSIVNVNPRECEGNDYTLSDMLKFCARGDRIDCAGNTDPCSIANKTMWEISNKTLIRQQFIFRLYTEGIAWNGREIVVYNMNCSGREKGQTGTIPISLYPVPDHVYLNLEICN
jgi:hypothetical protein